ncbi:MAG: response regulator transcription factor [Bdellovibrionales bacterium]
MVQRKILLVEDETSLAHLVSIQLKSYGFKVQIASNGQEARESLAQEAFDVILLDWMLPEESGIDILKWLRNSGEAYSKMPVIFVTALTSPGNIIQALEFGADDYLTKPFNESILVARINAVTRRADLNRDGGGSEESTGLLELVDLKLDVKGFEVSLGGEKLSLTRSEFLLLRSLMEEQGCVLTREDLISKVQGIEVNVTGRTIDTHVFGLRKKLKHYSACIETIRGVGYRINQPE